MDEITVFSVQNPPPLRSPILPALLAVLLIGGVNCAKQGMPTGGPEDKTPPTVVWTHPTNGSVEVPLGERIQIEFSERMDPRSVGRALFISPISGEDLHLRWHGRRVDVQFSTGLQADRTYVVTVGAEAQDAHRNRMKASYSFAFSTGARIDQGQISGKVRGGRRGTRAYVLAYDLRHRPDPDPVIDPTDYATQTDQEGTYLLSYVSPGSYRVFAFEDRDRDGAYTLGNDPLAVPPGDAVLSDSIRSVRVGEMKLAIRDTVGPALLSARPLHRSAVQLRFDKEIISHAVQIAIKGLSIQAQYGLPKEPSVLYLYTTPQQSGVSYTVLLQQAFDAWGNPLSEEGRTVSFTGSALPDTVRPELVGVQPEIKGPPLALDQTLTVIFDEAMYIDAGTGTWDITPAEPHVLFSWSSVHTLDLRPKGLWKEGVTYVLQADPTTFIDRAGNALQDSLNLSFRTVHRDTLGVLSGAIQDLHLNAQGALYIHIVGLGREKPDYTAIIRSAPDTTEIPFRKEVLPGEYTVWAFRDKDGNGRLSLGRPVPFTPSERFVTYPDTVQIRSRWTTEGIDLKLPKETK